MGKYNVCIGLAVVAVFGMSKVDASQSLHFDPSRITAANVMVKDQTQNLTIQTKPMDHIVGFLLNIETISKPDVISFSDIKLTLSSEAWIIENRTPRPINKFTGRYNGNKIGVFELPETLPAYSKARLAFPTHSISNVELDNQLSMFSPNIRLKGGSIDCSLTSETCYNFANDNERRIYETALSNMHDSFNRKSFTLALQDFYAQCKGFSECDAWQDTQLNQGMRNWIGMGMYGHSLEMKVMRNYYRGEGMGGGWGGNTRFVKSEASGWASYWQSYLNPDDPSYRNLSSNTYDTIFHEVAHAYGFSHDSGMTYGFAEQWAYHYSPNTLTQFELENISAPKLPDIYVDKKLSPNGNLELTFYHTNKQVNEFSLRLVSTEAFSYTSEINAEKSQLSLRFDQLPNGPIYFSAVNSDNDYMATFVQGRSDLSISPSFVVNDKRFTILADELLGKQENAWGIRKYCEQPNQLLATKVEYQQFWQYLHENDMFFYLDKTRYLSRDEPTAYMIWLVDLQPDQMHASWYGMQSFLGDNTGLICVEPL